jgi:ABC-type protease/lipase transport system fused ATPase/permease subunit
MSLPINVTTVYMASNVTTNVTANVTGPQFVGTDLYGALSIVTIFALLIGVVYLYEIRKAYAQSQQILTAADKKELVKNLNASVTAITSTLDKDKKTALSAEDQQSITDLTKLIQCLTDSETTGIIGFTRGQIAISVIFILGVAVILVAFSSSPNPSILSNVLSMLGATLAAVVGFYFGTKKDGQ